METLRVTKTIRIYDPAIDREKSDLVTFSHGRDNEKLVLKPGVAPVWFHVRRIAQSLWDRHVMSADSDDERRSRAFAASVVKVENMLSENGARVTWTPARTTLDGRDVPMTQDELEQFAPADRYEIGEVAYQLSFFPRDFAPSFRAPDSSVRVLVMTDAPSPSAAPSEPQAPSSDEPKAAQ